MLQVTIVRILLDIAQGVEYLHEAGIVHGDLKVCCCPPAIIGSGAVCHWPGRYEACLITSGPLAESCILRNMY